MSKKKQAELVLSITTKGKKFLSSLIDSTKNLGKTTVKVGATLTAAYAAVTAAIVKFGQRGVIFKNVQTSFRNLAARQGQDADKMLAKMKELSGGTVSELEIMKQANNAILLGLPVDKFGDMVQIARGAAQATGESMQHMLNSITVGMGRQSKLVLDNTGIVFDLGKAYDEYGAKVNKGGAQLTDYEKKQAFINKALEVGKRNLDNLGGVQDSASDKWNAMKNQVTNTVDKLSTLAIPAFKEVVRTTKPMIDTFTKMANHPFIKETAIALTKGFTIVNVVLEGVTRAIGEKLGPYFSAIPELLKGNLTKAKAIANIDTKSLSDIAVEQKKIMHERLAQVDADFKALDDQREKDRLEKIRQNSEEEIARKKEIQELENLDKEADNLIKQEQEAAHQQAITNLQQSGEMDRLNSAVKNAKTIEERRKAFIKRRLAIEEEANRKQDAFELASHKMRKWLQSEDVKNAQLVFGQISTLQNSKNKEFVAIGKAAAIANITISTAQGIAAAFALGPVLGPILAPIVAIAGAAQAAQVAGVQLAEGGIVRSTPGGIQATIGEGGSDEAVIPLDDDEAADRLGGLGGMTINFNGPIMGDRSQARELAIALDREFTSLRRDGESLAFDEDIY